MRDPIQIPHRVAATMILRETRAGVVTLERECGIPPSGWQPAGIGSTDSGSTGSRIHLRENMLFQTPGPWPDFVGAAFIGRPEFRIKARILRPALQIAAGMDYDPHAELVRRVRRAGWTSSRNSLVI